MANTSDEKSQDDFKEVEPDFNGNNNIESEQNVMQEMENQLEEERERSFEYEKKIKHLLADFENLKKRSEMDVKNRVDSIMDGIILKFLVIYDDFIRAKEAMSKQTINTQGLDGILKQMDSLLSELGVKPIDAIGEVFNPLLHEAISLKQDPSLDENTIIAELRKGYILKGRVIRPSLVEISKRNIMETNTNG